MLPNQTERIEIHRRMEATAEHLRLGLTGRTWRGLSGTWVGAGVGSSIDYQDHRPYLPGDDPRYIDWQAYGRTGQYIMKLYREEVSPLVDLVLDVSASMFVDGSKARRTLELFYFCIESARRVASLRCFASDGGKLRPVSLEEAVAGEPLFGAMTDGPPNLGLVPWRQGSLRVLISDLLFPGSPEAILNVLSAGKGRGFIFIPFSQGESKPDWSGNIVFIDCETQRSRTQRVASELLERYQRTYLRHFALWRERARKYAVVTARVGSEPEFREALQLEALPSGAVEFC